MPVLKSQQAASVFKDAIVLNMSDLRKEAARLIADAKDQARQIIDDAVKEKQRISTQAHDEAYERGHAEGVERGLQEGQEQGRSQAVEQTASQLKKLEQDWLESLGSWHERRADIDRQARKAVLEFALTLSRKLVHRIIAYDDDVVVDQVEVALGHVLKPFDIAIRIHGDDRDTLEKALPSLMTKVPQLEHVRLVEDETVGRGGCVIRCGEGQVDATIETQMQRVVELLTNSDAVSESV